MPCRVPKRRFSCGAPQHLTKNLEKDGIITRTVYPEIPPRVEYALSPIGKSMEPIILAMETWGKKYQALLSEEK